MQARQCYDAFPNTRKIGPIVRTHHPNILPSLIRHIVPSSPFPIGQLGKRAIGWKLQVCRYRCTLQPNNNVRGFQRAVQRNIQYGRSCSHPDHPKGFTPPRCLAHVPLLSLLRKPVDR